MMGPISISGGGAVARKRASKKTSKRKVVASSKRYSVYVIELDRSVLKSKRFRDANPALDPDKPCFYVGMTARTPPERFKQHKTGYKSGRFVKEHGKNLRPPLYTHYNPMTYQEAVAREPWLAQLLRQRGHGVWQN